MNKTTTQKTLEQEKHRLETQQPEMARSYQSFLDSYSKFNRMKAQFEQNSGACENKPGVQFRSPR